MLISEKHILLHFHNLETEWMLNLQHLTLISMADCFHGWFHCSMDMAISRIVNIDNKLLQCTLVWVLGMFLHHEGNHQSYPLPLFHCGRIILHIVHILGLYVLFNHNISFHFTNSRQVMASIHALTNCLWKGVQFTIAPKFNAQSRLKN